MNTPAPKRIRRSKELLGVSAVTFLTLCVWIGPHSPNESIGEAWPGR